MTRIEPLASSNRVEGVVDQLRTLILGGELAVGARLPNERELAESLGVNRSSVREALKRLEFLELIEVRHGQGSFVCRMADSSALQLVEALLHDRRTITPDLLRQLLVFRRHITLQVVELAALHHTHEQLERALALLERERASAGDPRETLDVDIAMNTLLGEATGNLMYRLVSNLFTRLIERLGPIYYNESRDDRRSLETHERLLEALGARDPSAARRVLEEMLDYSERAILEEAERLAEAGLIGPGAREPAT
jgi:GntR family transcriptional repressor for pyruvate dehydrogenase complex